MLGSIKEQTEFDNDSDFDTNNLLKLPETRLTMHAVCFKRILSNHNELWIVWEYCLQNDKMKTELISRIIRVKTQMESCHLFFGPSFGHRFFPILITYLKPYKLKKCQHAAVNG